MSNTQHYFISMCNALKPTNQPTKKLTKGGVLRKRKTSLSGETIRGYEMHWWTLKTESYEL
jgi:hypothetical protein